MSEIEYQISKDDALDALVEAKRRDRSDDPWECLRPPYGAESLLVWKLLPPRHGLDEILAAYGEARRCLLALEAAGLLALDRIPTPDPLGPGDRPDDYTQALWFRGEALERLGPRPKRRERRSPIPDAIRYAVLERDHFVCVLCGATDDLTLDHIIPVVMGGSDAPVNLRVLCRSCNSNKGTGLPDAIRLLGKPRPEGDAE